jgi:Rrf2 family protein
MIASQVNSHATFMRRVMQSLATAGIVESKGGREGGYVLRKSADEITLGEIYEAVSSTIEEPEVDLACGASALLDVELERILQDTEQRTIEYLRQYTITNVMERVDFFS